VSRSSDPRAELEPRELARYSRHLVLPEVGLEGQQRLRNARVLVVGAGGLGSPLTLYLAAAGVGRLGLVDFDTVDLSNLQRQILYGESDLDRPKLTAAAERLAETNPHVALDLYETRLDAANALEILRRHRQLRHPLPGLGRLRPAGQAQRLRQRLPLRGPGLGLPGG